ncbi:MAG: hypothetical protein WBQ25_10250, partial [Nitrososphaeraceae archaeon]
MLLSLTIVLGSCLSFFLPTNNILVSISELLAIKDILKTLEELGIVSYAITMTATILGVAVLVIGTTTNQSRADYGCVKLPGTNSTTGPYLCLDKPTESNIWKSPDQLNATGKLHGIPPTYVFLNETVTFAPTHECKLWKMDQAKGFPPYSLSLGDK